MGLIDLVLIVIPIIVPLAVLYKLGVRITPAFAVFAFIAGLAILFYVDVIMPVFSSFSLKALQKEIVEQYNLSSLPTYQGLMILGFVTLIVHTIATSIVLIPIGLVLKLVRGE